MESTKKYLWVFAIGLILMVPFLSLRQGIGLTKTLNWKIYDALARVKYKFSAPPDERRDIVLVTIDNETLTDIPQRWPYPRRFFCRLIENLNKAQAKTIAFDFAFFGDSAAVDDQLLKNVVTGKSNVILANFVDESGRINYSDNSIADNSAISGFVTKLAESDGIIRRNLTYLVDSQEPDKGHLSWEMRILQTVEGVEFSGLENDDNEIRFKNMQGQNWAIPIDTDTGSFLIDFRAHTKDFSRISFYRVLENKFDAAEVKNKIVLIGISSIVLSDIYNTPIGFIPGITLNANAFLSLYTRDFIGFLPVKIEITAAVICLLISVFFIGLFSKKSIFLFIIIQALILSALSLFLFARGKTFDYCLFLSSAIFLPCLGESILCAFQKNTGKLS